jgi:hypothetical protein
VLGRLRRLLSRSADEPQQSERASGRPWYLQDDEKVTPERIEAARQRLKETIPPPEDESDHPKPGH